MYQIFIQLKTWVRFKFWCLSLVSLFVGTMQSLIECFNANSGLINLLAVWLIAISGALFCQVLRTPCARLPALFLPILIFVHGNVIVGYTMTTWRRSLTSRLRPSEGGELPPTPLGGVLLGDRTPVARREGALPPPLHCDKAGPAGRAGPPQHGAFFPVRLSYWLAPAGGGGVSPHARRWLVGCHSPHGAPPPREGVAGRCRSVCEGAGVWGRRAPALRARQVATGTTRGSRRAGEPWGGFTELLGSARPLRRSHCPPRPADRSPGSPPGNSVSYFDWNVGERQGELRLFLSPISFCTITWWHLRFCVRPHAHPTIFTFLRVMHV